MEEQINLVDENGTRIGAIGKLAAHQEGRLHEAFSIIIFNEKGEMLLQRRASAKYHSAGLWADTCSGHARFGEDLAEAAKRRLREEMGFACELEEIFHFTYKVPLPNGLVEHEVDYCFVGHFDGEPIINPEEADAYDWVSCPDLIKKIESEPDAYVYWFKEIMRHPSFIDYLECKRYLA